MLFHFRNDARQARHAKADHKLHAAKQLFGAISSIGHHDLKSLGMSVGFERAINLQKERILHIGNDDSKDEAFPPRKRAGVEIRVVIEFFGCPQHTGATGGFDDFGLFRTRETVDVETPAFWATASRFMANEYLFPIATGAAEEILAANYPQM